MIFHILCLTHLLHSIHGGVEAETELNVEVTVSTHAEMLKYFNQEKTCLDTVLPSFEEKFDEAACELTCREFSECDSAKVTTVTGEGSGCQVCHQEAIFEVEKHIGASKGRRELVTVDPVLTPEVEGVLFDGNTYLEYTNPIFNDFTIYVEFKSDECLEGGRFWYNGCGIVDADIVGMNNDYGLSIINTGQVTFGVGRSGATAASLPLISNPENTYLDGEWHSATATRDGTTGELRLYVDGVLQDVSWSDIQTVGVMPTSGAPRKGHIGKIRTAANGDGKNFVGEMRNVRFFTSVVDTITASGFIDGAPETNITNGGEIPVYAFEEDQCFNGIDEYYRITNQIGEADFTLYFEMRAYSPCQHPVAAGVLASEQWYSGCGLVDRDWPGYGNNDFGVSLSQTGEIMLGVGDGNNRDDTTVASQSGYADGAWHSIQVTRDSSAGKAYLYVDSSLEGVVNNANTDDLTKKPHFFVGASQYYHFFDGCIKDIIMYDSIIDIAVQEEVGECPHGYTQVGTLFNGNYVAESSASFIEKAVSVTSIEECQLMCEATNGCVAFSYGGATREEAYIKAQFQECSMYSQMEATMDYGDNTRMCAMEYLCSVPPEFTVGPDGHYFDGLVSSAIVIPNPFMEETDFSIYMEFKADSQCEHGSASGWWTGCGLVDADIRGLANDWGLSIGEQKIQFGTGGTSQGSIKTPGRIDWADGEWHSILARRWTSGLLELYVDNHIYSTMSHDTGLMSDSTTVTIGASNRGVKPFTGYIRNVRMFCGITGIASPPEVESCPNGYESVGSIAAENNANQLQYDYGIVEGVESIAACAAICDSNPSCQAFMYGGKTANGRWAEQYQRCKWTAFSDPNQDWGDNWRFCRQANLCTATQITDHGCCGGESPNSRNNDDNVWTVRLPGENRGSPFGTWTDYTGMYLSFETGDVCTPYRMGLGMNNGFATRTIDFDYPVDIVFWGVASGESGETTVRFSIDGVEKVIHGAGDYTEQTPCGQQDIIMVPYNYFTLAPGPHELEFHFSFRTMSTMVQPAVSAYVQITAAGVCSDCTCPLNDIGADTVFPPIKLEVPMPGDNGEFDGTNSVQETNILGDDFTICFDFKSQGCASAENGNWDKGCAFVDSDMMDVDDEFAVTLSADGEVMYGLGNPYVTIKSAAGYADDEWHHVRVTKTHYGDIELYVDGDLKRRKFAGESRVTASPIVTFGKLGGNEDRYFTGFMQNAVLHNYITDCQPQQEAPACPSRYRQMGTLSTYNMIMAHNKRVHTFDVDYDTCQALCDDNENCVAFMYGGTTRVDKFIGQYRQCAISEVQDTPDTSYGDNWRFCHKIVPYSPPGFTDDDAGVGCDPQMIPVDEPAYYTKDFTIAFDFKSRRCHTETPGTVKHFNRQGSTNKRYDQACVIFDAGVFGVGITQDGEVIFSVGDDVKIKSAGWKRHANFLDNNYHSVVITRKMVDGVIQLFIDGDLVAIGDGAIRESLDIPSEIGICGKDGTESNRFNGMIRRIKFYEEAIVDVYDGEEVDTCDGDFIQLGSLSENNYVYTIHGHHYKYLISLTWERTISDCSQLCRDTPGCVALSYGGDTVTRNPWWIGQKGKCELFYRETPNADKGDNTRFCRYRRGPYPKCTTCGPRERECWSQCDFTDGPCEECNSPFGHTGYCCRKGWNGAGAHPMCATIPDYLFFHPGYHMCVVPDIGTCSLPDTAPTGFSYGAEPTLFSCSVEACDTGYMTDVTCDASWHTGPNGANVCGCKGKEAPVLNGCVPNQVIVEIYTGVTPGEISWELLSSDGSTVLCSSPAYDTATQAEQTLTTTCAIPSYADGAQMNMICYDTEGDGWEGGYVQLKAMDGTILKGPMCHGNWSPTQTELIQLSVDNCDDHDDLLDYECRFKAVNGPDECFVRNEEQRVTPIDVYGTGVSGVTINKLTKSTYVDCSHPDAFSPGFRCEADGPLPGPTSHPTAVITNYNVNNCMTHREVCHNSFNAMEFAQWRANPANEAIYQMFCVTDTFKNDVWEYVCE